MTRQSRGSVSASVTRSPQRIRITVTSRKAGLSQRSRLPGRSTWLITASLISPGISYYNQIEPLLTKYPYDPTKAKHPGSTYPINIALCDANRVNLSTAAVIVHAVSVTLASTDAPGILADAGNANPDMDFRFDSSSYIFNLKTTGLGIGTYNLNFTAGGDPITHAVQFQIK